MNNHGGVSSAWTESLSRNQHPDDKALLAHLRAVHQHNAGFTEMCASTCRDNAGRNSYEWLAEAVPRIDGIRVLDLACGSGPLLETLYSRNTNVHLKGVDMSPEELALAKVRLPYGAVTLFQLKAQDLNTIGDDSIDVVLCHWALTLMNPIGPVLDEIRRVLSEGGRFAALVDGPMNMASGYTEVHDLIYKYAQAELPGYGKVDLGDPRIRGTDSLNNLIGAAFPKAEVTVESNVVSMEGPADEIAKMAAGFFYAAFTLTKEIRGEMLSELSDLLAISNTSGNNVRQARFSMPINRLLVIPPPE
ncbi:MAG: methyltransferase domain-containing protein [Burkholderiales bacterium]|nr:methyltransferase domain-containing protein [Burkholderiales bacterium]